MHVVCACAMLHARARVCVCVHVGGDVNNSWFCYGIYPYLSAPTKMCLYIQ